MGWRHRAVRTAPDRRANPRRRGCRPRGGAGTPADQSPIRRSCAPLSHWSAMGCPPPRRLVTSASADQPSTASSRSYPAHCPEQLSGYYGTKDLGAPSGACAAPLPPPVGLCGAGRRRLLAQVARRMFARVRASSSTGWSVGLPSKSKRTGWSRTAWQYAGRSFHVRSTARV